MMKLEDNIEVKDKKGFVYRVVIVHWPVAGVSVAFHETERIASREYGKVTPPTGDSDKEWEAWEERFREWADASISDLIISCENHFNENHLTDKGL